MKRWIFWSFLSVATFAVGCAVVLGIRTTVNFRHEANKFSTESIRPVEIQADNHSILGVDAPPVFDQSVDYPKSSKVKLLQTGWFHSDEVPYRSGEKWLGLFRTGNRYELTWTTIKNSRDKTDELFDREISTTDPRRSIFLLRGARDLETGPITTVFDDIDGEGFFDLRSGKSFGLRGSFWWLSTENIDESGLPRKGTSLVLKQSGYDPRVLRTLPNGCNDSWRLLWVGDLNHDQSLDFLIDVTDHYNVYEPTLFISSPGYGYSVYASFRRVGC